MINIDGSYNHPYHFDDKKYLSFPLEKVASLVENWSAGHESEILDQIHAIEESLNGNTENFLCALLREGEEYAAIDIIEHGYKRIEDPDPRTNYSPIHLAVKKGFVGVLKALYKRGVSLETKVQGTDITPLSFCFAPLNSDRDCLLYIINHLPKESLFSHVKLEFGREASLVQMCFDKGMYSLAACIVQLRGSIGEDQRILHYLVRSDVDLKQIEDVIKLGANINLLESVEISLYGLNLVTPLHYAIRSGRKDKKELIELLMKYGADIHLTSQKALPLFEKTHPGGNRSPLEEAAVSDASLAKHMLSLATDLTVYPNSNSITPHRGDFVNGKYSDPNFVLLSLQNHQMPTQIVKACYFEPTMDRKVIESALNQVECSQDSLTRALLALVEEIGNVDIYISSKANVKEGSEEEGVLGFFPVIEKNKIVVLGYELGSASIAETIVHELGHLVAFHYGLNASLKEPLMKAYQDYLTTYQEENEDSYNFLDGYISEIIDCIKDRYKPEKTVEELIARTLQMSFKIDQVDPESPSRKRIAPFIKILKEALLDKQTMPHLLSLKK